jgi:hypothetical protein
LQQQQAAARSTSYRFSSISREYSDDGEVLKGLADFHVSQISIDIFVRLAVVIVRIRIRTRNFLSGSTDASQHVFFSQKSWLVDSHCRPGSEQPGEQCTRALRLVYSDISAVDCHRVLALHTVLLSRTAGTVSRRPAIGRYDLSSAGNFIPQAWAVGFCSSNRGSRARVDSDSGSTSRACGAEPHRAAAQRPPQNLRTVEL